MQNYQNDPEFAGYDEEGEAYYHSSSKENSLLIAGPCLLLIAITIVCLLIDNALNP
jgi:hypothetical protein